MGQDNRWEVLGVMGAASTDGLRSRRLHVRILPGILVLPDNGLQLFGRDVSPYPQLVQATNLKKLRFLRYFQGFLRFLDLQSPARFGTLLPSFSAKPAST